MPAEIPEVNAQTGLVVTAGSTLAVNLGGGVVTTVLWPANYIPRDQDRVTCIVVDGVLVVIGPVVTEPRPETGTVSGSAVSGRVPVSTSIGTIQARYIGTAPTNGTLVRLDWQSTDPWVWPNAAASLVAPPTPPPSEAPQAPPPPPETGTAYFTATDSGSFQVGGTWGFQRNNVVQWRYGSSPENRGAWFYGGAPSAALAGRTITRTRINLPGRQRVGDYNSALTLHLYRHTQNSRPSGDVSRVAGPNDVVLAANSGGGWIDLPASWGQDIVNGGGGIAVAGSPYIALFGIDADPASGQLSLDWSR